MFERRILSALMLVSLSGSLFTARADAPPEVTELRVNPASLTLQNARDRRSIVVTGASADGRTLDLTHEAVFTPSNAHVEMDGMFAVPVAAGACDVVVSAAGLEAKVPVEVQSVETPSVDFVRDIEPMLSKVGCNAGTCHGARQGKRGFKLSLRGYDPLFDYRALVDDISGRRFNRAKPSDSLMLLKPTQAVAHEGGFLFDETSREYKLIEQWIAEGCRFSSQSRVERLELFPLKPLLELPGQTQQMQVIAWYPDGTNRDVTADSIYESSNFEVATVAGDGLVTAVRRGETPILVRYEGAYATTTATVLGRREGFVWRETPEYNFIDAHVNSKLKRSKILPSGLCTDAEFLRRVSLDLTGLPATGAEVRAFLADPRPAREKREAKVDELLQTDEYADHWTLKWSDLLLSNRKYITEKGVWSFRNWIRSAIATNKPFDEFVYELLTASGSTFENPPANYYRIAREPRIVMENMTQVFLGTRFVCAQCHDHPFEKWTQQQYYELSAFFGGVGRKAGPKPGEEVVYDLRTPRSVTHAGTGQVASPKFPYEFEGPALESADLREKLARWLIAEENPYFATSVVNRYWSYFMGRGIIDPVDDIRGSNPPTNPELLDALTADFVENGFDLKRLIRTIVTSHTYQRSIATNRFNEEDRINYSHATPRRLAAEQLFDSIIVATGAPKKIPGAPPGFRAAQLPDPKVSVSFLEMFGRAPREQPCECERSSEVSLAQTLSLINGPTVSEAIIHPQGLVARLIGEQADNDRLVEEVYLSVVNRFPTDSERGQGRQYLETVGAEEGAQDLMWALINSPEFLFNR